MQIKTLSLSNTEIQNIGVVVFANVQFSPFWAVVRDIVEESLLAQNLLKAKLCKNLDDQNFNHLRETETHHP